MKEKLPGNMYFSLMENVMKTHLEVGELYMEFSCCDDKECSFCSKTDSIPIDPVPRPLPGANSHYETY